MKLFKLYKTFRDDESGAVTVDWVVLAAAIVALAVFVGGIIFDRVGLIAEGIDEELIGVETTRTTEGGGEG